MWFGIIKDEGAGGSSNFNEDSVIRIGSLVIHVNSVIDSGLASTVSGGDFGFGPFESIKLLPNKLRLI